MEGITSRCSAGGKEWAKRHPEVVSAIEKILEQRVAKAPEASIDVVINFTCTPSTLEDIKSVLKTFPIANSTYRFYSK